MSTQLDDIVGDIADEALGGMVGADDDVLGDVLGDVDDLMGDDDVEGDVLGAVRRRRRFRAKRRMIAAGVQRVGERKQFLPFPATAFTAASGLILTVQVNAQRPFRGSRIVAAVTRTGATSTGLVTLSDLRVGNDPQPIAVGETPIEAFSPTAFDLSVDLDSSQPGVVYTAVLRISVAPGAADRVDVALALFGAALR